MKNKIAFIFQLYLHDGRVLETTGYVCIHELLECKTDDQKNSLAVRVWSKWAWGVEPNGKNHRMGAHKIPPESEKYFLLDGPNTWLNWRNPLTLE